ncbi:M20/M25/M40 family metallo-hydrolase [Emcibacter nanhaiensis]|uniref:M20/M25/M40 family metallo-hydrolase n=1 Tax=Emcibacter nanhaiensis TaxID=1505037 RepID=A0A501PP01_9PROT|nr:M20/M25/M40 family metallo-hydrolase [Emcibacter nanhaiensis]TPD61714.1 M20/M25/M40 family metallo-hydrolase [Emcibacter nanhaiensis]
MRLARLLPAFIGLICFTSGTALAAASDSDHAQKTFEIYKHIVEIDSSKTSGGAPAVAHYLADQLLAAGFPKEDVQVVMTDGVPALIARLRGDSFSGKKPILILGHMDVVEANPADWERPPFTLTEDDTHYFGRGSEDDKFGIAQATATFIRLKKEGFVPNRDIYLAFSGDEETGMVSTKMLAAHPVLSTAEYALNTDAGGGMLEADGTPVAYGVQAAEKTYATWEVTATNPGGHSSRPRPDNAIYDLADAIRKIQAHRFPVRWSDMTLNYFRETGQKVGGELGAAMIAFADNPEDTAASDRLWTESSYVGTTRTTCVVTMLRGGHAENALPQSATATVNCRIFPGVKVAEVEQVLKKVVANDKLEFKILGDADASPISEPRADVMAAVAKAVHARYPGLKLIPYMESGGTDGKQFRKNGIPTWGVSSLFMDPNEMYAHGLNERVTKAAFTGALDHWSIILKTLAGGK